MTKKYKRILITLLLLFVPLSIAISILVWWGPVGVGFLMATNKGPANVQDSLALVDLYHSTNGTHWIDKWDLEDPVYKWGGVRLDGKGSVVRLNLKSNNLSGSIPASLGNLSKLQYLWMQENQLIGEIPTSLGNLSNLLVLDLSDNRLSGKIPEELENLKKLERLNLGFNQFDGEIPTSFRELSKLQ